MARCNDGESDHERQRDVFPALLVPYRELSKLRYDYPLILLHEGSGPSFVDTLSGVMSRLLHEIAPPGDAGRQLRQHVLRLEIRMREQCVAKKKTSLDKLWKRARKSLLGECDGIEAELLEKSLATARFALTLDGELADCDARLPKKILQHMWVRVEAQRVRYALENINTLIIKLRNILKVDDLKARQSRTPQSLKRALGRNYKEAFDFELISGILEDAAPHNRLPEKRCRRIRSVLKTLESQRFFISPGSDKSVPANAEYQFVFSKASSALQAFSKRLPEMVRLVKAIAIAELESENEYRESRHTSYFENFGAQSLAPADRALFPSYLVCLQDRECSAREKANLLEIASSDLPMKILFQVSDLLGDPNPLDKQAHSASFALQLANSFVTPGNAYVLQSASSDLYRQREVLRKGLEFDGPAIFSIYAVASDAAANMPGYLSAAAATESRAFPTFSYDPLAGPGLVDRYDIAGNPVLEAAWPRMNIHYEDEDLQAINEQHAFTLVDIAVTDPRYKSCFVMAPRNTWNDNMLPVAEFLDLADENRSEKIPYVAVVDGNDILRRLLVDQNLIRMAWRCGSRWRALQEHGGVNNSYVCAALASERAKPFMP